MRILHVSTRLILGGSQENTVLSCEGQARLGHDVHLAFGPIYGPEGSLLDRVQQFRTADSRSITTHVVPDLIRAIHPFRDFRAFHQLKALIAELQPDIVHTHSSKAGILARAAAHAAVVSTRPLLAKPLGIVHTIHGPPFMPLEGSPLRRLKTRLINHVYELSERFAAKRCHVIVSVADAMTRQFLARHIGRPDLFATVYSGMEVAPYLTPTPPPGQSRDEVRQHLGLAPDRFVIGAVARLAEHKGHDDLLDALAAELPRNPRWLLLWVGDGWWRERLVARARALGLVVRELDREAAPNASPGPAQLLLTGLVPPQRIPGLMRAMDLLVHPSYREGLPRTVPQALLAGACPVAYDVDGAAEACIDHQTGRLVPLADIAKLRQAIADLADDPEQRTALARRGRELCKTRFAAETMVAELEKVYAQALTRASAVPGATVNASPR